MEHINSVNILSAKKRGQDRMYLNTIVMDGYRIPFVADVADSCNC